MKLQRARGVRDHGPETQIIREGIIDNLKTIFRSYGFSPIQTPIIERQDLLVAKYAGGDEILREIFTFKDQGKRDLALRYDLTVPMCRYVGMNQQMKMPFKRYQIDRVFRDGPIKLGRYREFYQCDIDIVGAKGMMAETQLIEIAAQVFKKLNLKVNIKINNRKVLNGVLDDSKVSDDLKDTTILTIDKLEKIGADKVQSELKDKGLTDESIKKIFSFLKIKNIKDVKLTTKDGKTGLLELEELFANLSTLGIKPTFDISLARGLSYYTGTVFEIFLVDNQIKSATAGGGRYDDIIGNFLEARHTIPAVGISFGLEVITDVMKSQENKKSVTDIYIVPINTQKESLLIAKELRKYGINIDVDIIGRGISKNLTYANILQIPYTLIVGGDEISSGKYKLKDMKSGEEFEGSIEEIANKVKKQ